MVAPNKRNVRGKTRCVILDKLIEANGSKPLPITIKPSYEKQTRKYCEKLSNEIGVEKWKQMPRADINTMLDRIKSFPCLTMKEKFALDLTQKHKLEMRFAQTLQKFPNVVEAKRNPHESVSNQENWDYLCDRFSRNNLSVVQRINSVNRSKMPFHHREGSRHLSNMNGEMVGQIELFKLVHWKSQDGWISQEARDYYLQRHLLRKERGYDRGEICEKVLGQKSGYVKGLGFGPKPISFSKSRPSSSEREIELEHRLVETQQQQLETQEDRIDQLEALVQNKINHIINNLKK
ncbi:hypothetical protein AAG906_038010 [Vitis piasezkii]